ncbi:inosine/xanthosine triphosphatase [Mariniphaga anaerophila]|uniref:Probable inosine/xanthosine triphosphatase n=1 Tax=Mariniphaga anaerophila TaxID=1484053 RepID=A0A1M5E107_9BACT|nr:inosine/xanthosine triphosphatase [Mariniphaga anaerophila]SHF72804.1 inosine/xanthosine triphosphatase [Mariniphaga anaerophila]
MKIVVASENPVKLKAVESGFKTFFGDAEFESVQVESGVSDQPLTDKETLVGARNRVAEARKTIRDADFWVGIEGGVQAEENGLAAFAWIVINGAGKNGEARTAAFMLPQKVAHLVAGGVELGVANDMVFHESNSKQKSGAVGLLTHNQIDRTELYRQGVILALIPFVNSGLY